MVTNCFNNFPFFFFYTFFAARYSCNLKIIKKPHYFLFTISAQIQHKVSFPKPKDLNLRQLPVSSTVEATEGICHEMSTEGNDKILPTPDLAEMRSA